MRGAGEGAAAEAAYRQAIALRPDYAVAHLNLGATLEEAGRLADAVACYRQAVALTPDHATAQVRLGNALFALGDAAAGEAALLRASEIDPALYEAHSNLAIFLRARRRFAEAEAACRRAIALKPETMAAYSTLADLLIEAGRVKEAVATWRRALAIKPDAAMLYALGAHLAGGRRKDEAIACFDRAVAVQPDDIRSLSASTHQRRHLCRWDGLAADEARVLTLLRDKGGRVSPFELLAMNSTAEDQLRAAAGFVKPLIVMPELQLKHGAPRQSNRNGGDRIRLGYLSADFHEHATAHLTAELFERHDRTRFEVIGYSTMPGDGSAMRARLERGFDRFVDLAGMGDEVAARRIHEDGVDILVDLKGHTEGARLGILARRPAPLQVAFLGYPGTTGADFIDYAIADRHVVTPASQAQFRERLVLLPDSYQPNDRQRQIAETGPTRAEAGLPETGVVFCCFNNSYKIAAEIFTIWMRLLNAVPGSILWLLEANQAVRDNLAREAVRRGVLPDRLVWAQRLPPPLHLARHSLADLFLDTLPYNAHTTASDALWAGLPVLTCPGETFASRVAASLLDAVGLPELATSSLADYEALALRLATDPASLAALKAKLAANRLTTPLFDSARFTRHLEAAYRQMWEMWREGEEAMGFEVEAIEAAE
ncbi:MAG: tetratricopeptide repeat protein [Alphaproteobacteria bacterium]|nr:tetratricopeptide repeat protein [Alphaproteobacteria bacterium]